MKKNLQLEDYAIIKVFFLKCVCGVCVKFVWQLKPGMNLVDLISTWESPLGFRNKHIIRPGAQT